MTDTLNPRLPELNPRLLKILGLIPPCECLSDIGTDHAYIPILAVSKGIAKVAIASDINPGPVNRARENVCEFDLLDKISLRLGAGLSTISKDEADVIVIAGMGGILISDILEQTKAVSQAAKRLILQPMTASLELREYLLTNGFLIESEHLVAEEEKIYTIICARFVGKTGTVSKYTKRDLFLGKNISKTSPDLFERHRSLIIKKYEKRLAGLSKSDRTESKEELKKVKEIIEILK